MPATAEHKPVSAGQSLINLIESLGHDAGAAATAVIRFVLRKPHETVIDASDATFGKVARAHGRVVINLTDEQAQRLLDADASSRPK